MTKDVDVPAIVRESFSGLWGLNVGRFSHCGPKNNGNFGYMDGYMDGYKFRIGLTHLPMTKINRMAFLTCAKKGWRNA